MSPDIIKWPQWGGGGNRFPLRSTGLGKLSNHTTQTDFALGCQYAFCSHCVSHACLMQAAGMLASAGPNTHSQRSFQSVLLVEDISVCTSPAASLLCIYFYFFGNTLVIFLSSHDEGRGVMTQIIVAPEVVLYTRPCQSPQSIFLAILKRMKENFFLDGFASKWGYDPAGSHLATIMGKPNLEQEEFGEKQNYHKRRQYPGEKIWVLDLAMPEGMASKLFVNVRHQSYDGKFSMLLAHSTHRLSCFLFFPNGSGRWRWKSFVLLTSSSNLCQHSASTSALKFLSSSPIL